LRWDDLVGTEGLFRVDEGGENLSSLLAFAWRVSEAEENARSTGRDLLFMEEGSGLLMRGMMAVGVADSDCGM
jgi:hypothetical protein